MSGVKLIGPETECGAMAELPPLRPSAVSLLALSVAVGLLDRPNLDPWRRLPEVEIRKEEMERTTRGVYYHVQAGSYASCPFHVPIGTCFPLQ